MHAATTKSPVGVAGAADVSRPLTQGWRKTRNGTQGGAKVGKSKRVYWLHPFLLALIQPALDRNDWSPSRTVNALHRSHPALFDAPGARLNKGTLWKWIVPNERRFTDVVKQKIMNGRSLAGSGRTGVLAPHPEIVEKIKTTLRGLRTSGRVVNIQIARAIMIAIIRDAKPELLEKFKCSERFVRCFLDSTLNWSSRRATRAAKHIPENAGELCERTFFRLVHAIENDHIPAKVCGKFEVFSSTDSIASAHYQLRPDWRLHPA